MADRILTHDQVWGINQHWHGKSKVVPEITLDNNWLAEWDVVPVRLEKRGTPSRYFVLEASDVPDLEIGRAYTETFKPVDNKAFLQLVRDSISGTKHTIVSVGSVRNRGRVFLSIELTGMDIFEAAGRKFSAFLNFGNGHGKSSVLWVNTSNTCTVCDNTFTANLFSVENKDKSGGGSDMGDDIAIQKRHTKHVIMVLPELAKLIDRAVGVQGEFQAALNSLSKIAITPPVARSLFAGFVGRKSPDVDKGLSTRSNNIVNRLTNLFENGKGNNGRDFADAFSAITDFYSHESSGKSDNPFKQVVSSDYGSGQVAKTDFWSIVTAEDAEERTCDMIRRGESLLAHTV